MRKGRLGLATLVSALFVTSVLGAPATAAVAPPLAPVTPSAELASSTDMLRVLNEHRYAIGAPTIPADPRLVQAAQNHAVYSVLNNTGGHYETPGKPGFTGVLAQDRARAMGYTAPFVSEVASGASDALEGVRKLWDAPYHRLGMMHPQTRVFGWGREPRSSGVVVVGNIGKDFSTVPIDVVRSPAKGQTGIPSSWSGHESPSPVRPGSSGPYGYPVMIVYGGYKAVDVRGISLHHNGTPLSLFVSPQEFERDYALVVPDKPLPVGKIDVRMDLTVAGKWLTEEWSFYTAGAAVPSTAPAPAPAPTPAPANTGFHSAWVSQDLWPTINVGETVTYKVTFKNTGTTTWTKYTATEARLGVNGDDRTFSNIGMAVGWPIPDRPAVQDAASVPPGASTTFSFQFKGVAPGTYSLHLRPVIDGITWMEDYGVYMRVAVR